MTDNTPIDEENIFWNNSNFFKSISAQHNIINKVRPTQNDHYNDLNLGLKTSAYPKAIYEFYTEMNIKAQGILELGASLVYDMYKNWAKMKAAAPKEYESLKNKGEGDIYAENHNISTIDNSVDISDGSNTSFNEFIFFMSTLTQVNGNYDLNLIMNSKEYILKVSKYRDMLTERSEKYNWDENPIITLDIENSFSDMINVAGNIWDWYNGIKYKIQPILIGISKSVLGTGDVGTIPITKYNVLIDIDSVCRYIIISARKITQETVFDDEKSFINEIIKRIGPHTCDQLSKHVALTILNNRHIVQTGWTKFIAKFNDEYMKSVDSDKIKNIIYKMKDTTNGIPFNYNDIFDPSDEFNNATLNIAMTYSDPSRFITFMRSEVDKNNGYDNKDVIIALIRMLFSRAFTSFYEFTYVLLNDFDEHLCRTITEIDELNLSELSEIINSIDDYDCKSFFTDCTLRFKEGTRCNNNLLHKAVSKMSMLKRNFWIEITNMFNILSNCMIKISLLEQTGPVKKLSISVSKSLADVTDLIINCSRTSTSIFESYLTRCGSRILEESPKFRETINIVKAVSNKPGYGKHDTETYVREFIHTAVGNLEGKKQDNPNKTLVGLSSISIRWKSIFSPHVSSFNTYDLWNGILDELDMDDWNDLKDFPRFDVNGVIKDILDSIYMRFGINSYEGTIISLADD